MTVKLLLICFLLVILVPMSIFSPYWKGRGIAIDTKGAHVLKGYSIAAKYTGFYVPSLNILLDCGVESDYKPDSIFITHGHHDHSKAIVSTLMSTNDKHPLIFCPIQTAGYLSNTINASFSLTKNTPMTRIDNKYTLIGMHPNETKGFIFHKKDPITKQRQIRWYTEAIKCNHTVPTLGYGFVEIRSKLKDEFIGIDGKDLNNLVKSGIEISHFVEYPIFCYLCDTDHEVLKNPLVEKYPTIIIECTFINNKHINEAEEDKHMHWINLKPYIMNNPNKKFILIHFSARYSNDEIREFFDNENIPNVYPFINPKAEIIEDQSIKLNNNETNNDDQKLPDNSKDDQKN